jgi:hypothetical protein
LTLCDNADRLYKSWGFLLKLLFSRDLWHARGQRFDPAILHFQKARNSMRITGFFVFVCIALISKFFAFFGTEYHQRGAKSCQGLSRCAKLLGRNRWQDAWDILQKASEASRMTAEILVAEVGNCDKTMAEDPFEVRLTDLAYNFLTPIQTQRLTQTLVKIHLQAEVSQRHFPLFPFNSTTLFKCAPHCCGT